MNEAEQLLAAVIASPDDDAVRLVYADWLDEHGNAARAEFIRTQIRRETLPRKDPQRTELVLREKELARQHASEWLQKLPVWARPKERSLIATEGDWVGFRRGFLQGVCWPGLPQFRADAPRAFATEPITHLYLGDRTVLPQLASHPLFLGLTGLRFGHYVLGDRGTIVLSGLPVLPRLRQLWLYKNEIGNRGIRALTKWPALATVEDLELGFNEFQAAGIKALIACPYLTRLRRLDMSALLIADKTKYALRERFGDVVEL